MNEIDLNGMFKTRPFNPIADMSRNDPLALYDAQAEAARWKIVFLGSLVVAAMTTLAFLFVAVQRDEARAERDDAIATRAQMAGWYMDQERRYAAQTWEISECRRDLDACHENLWRRIDAERLAP